MVCGFMVNKVCGLGFKSVVFVVQVIQVGQVQSIVVGGMENMSLVFYLFDVKVCFGYCFGDGQVYDVILCDGLMCVIYGYYMGIIVENVVKEYGIICEMQDELVLYLQCKAAVVIEFGVFIVEIVLVNVVI